MQKYFLATNDVELTSIRYNKQRIKSGEAVLKDGLPRLLDLYHRYGVKGTFFVTCDIAKAFPEIVRLIVAGGHELASHSYDHSDSTALDLLSYKEQFDVLSRAKKCLEDFGGVEVLSFRSPALRVNRHTPQALIDAGFRIDSSISPQRADMFFSFGALKKLDRLFAPRMPYFVSYKSLTHKGDSPLFEIPISAMLIPYIGTTMRIIPGTVSLLKHLLHYESSHTGKPINFLIHPNECFVEDDEDTVSRRSNNLFLYLVAEKLRSSLKQKNLGTEAISLYEEHIKFFKCRDYVFCSCHDYFKLATGNNN